MPAGIKIILDTNWFVSATLNKISRRRLFKIITNKDITVLWSDELLLEYKAVIQRDKFKKFITGHQIDRFLTITLLGLKKMRIKRKIHLSRDPKDNYLL